MTRYAGFVTGPAPLTEEVWERFEEALLAHRQARLDRERVEALVTQAHGRGCGLFMVEGRPETLKVSPWIQRGTLVIMDAEALKPGRLA